MQNELNVKTFNDYRAFLIAHMQNKKRSDQNFTFGSWAQRLKISGDHSSIAKIVRGERNPGNEITERFIKYFKFSSDEATYFKDLIRLHKIKKDPRLSVLLMEKMGKEHPDGKIKILDDKTFSVISNWYCFAIREMVRLDGFLEDPEWISNALNFKVTPTESKKAIDLLLSVGLLRRNNKSELEIVDGNIVSENDVASEAVKRCHEQLLDNAKIALRKYDTDLREFTAESFTMSYARIPQAKEFIRSVRKKFVRLFEEEGGDGTFHFQVQFFPLTKQVKGKEIGNEIKIN